jgi:hypothetical protein
MVFPPSVLAYGDSFLPARVSRILLACFGRGAGRRKHASEPSVRQPVALHVHAAAEAPSCMGCDAYGSSVCRPRFLIRAHLYIAELRVMAQWFWRGFDLLLLGWPQLFDRPG